MAAPLEISQFMLLENMQPPIEVLLYFFTLKPLLEASLGALHSINDYMENDLQRNVKQPSKFSSQPDRSVK